MEGFRELDKNPELAVIIKYTFKGNVCNKEG